MSVITLKPNLCTTYIELDKHFGRKEREREIEMDANIKIKIVELNYMN